MPATIRRMNDFDTGWLVGFLEGEGCFLSGPPSAPRMTRVVGVTTDLDVAQKAAVLMGCTVTLGNKPRLPHHKQQYVVTRAGRPARDLMRRLRPHMGTRRRAAIDKALSSCPGHERPRDGSALTYEEAEAARALLAQGLGPSEVGRRLGVSRYVIRSVRRGYVRPEPEPAP